MNIDQIIAEEVLGWTDIDYHFDRVVPMTQWLGGKPPGANWVEEVPRYSTDIQSMYELIKSLTNDYDYVSCIYDCGTWTCYIKSFEPSDLDDGIPEWVIKGIGTDNNTLMMAVCNAALRTVGYEQI